jgi:hypothetical protein
VAISVFTVSQLSCPADHLHGAASNILEEVNIPNGEGSCSITLDCVSPRIGTGQHAFIDHFYGVSEVLVSSSLLCLTTNDVEYCNFNSHAVPDLI